MRIGILGGGVAGLSSAYFLKDHFDDIRVHEASDCVGGLARSFEWHGFTCDHAPHRLFTTNEALLKEMLDLVPMDQFRRRSRIFLQGKWIQDPVNAAEMVLKFFPFTSWKIVWHYLFRKKHPDDNFEALVLSKFGKGLNQLFFKPYSEKLFGIPSNQISAAWGRRKIRVAGLKDMLKRNSKLYFKHFYYPKAGGYGDICNRLHQEIEDKVQLRSRLVGVSHNGFNNTYTCTFDQNGRTQDHVYDLLITSLPISLFSKLLGLDLSLRFRPAKLAYLHINKPMVTDNHWFYFAGEDFIINRVAEFKNFATSGAPEKTTVLCCEVTRVENYSVERVVGELESIGLIKKEDVLDSKTVPLPFAYPIYDLDYENQMQRAQSFFADHPNIHHVGRHAQFAHKDVDEIIEEAKRIAGVVIGDAKPAGVMSTDGAPTEGQTPIDGSREAIDPVAAMLTDR